MTSLDPSIYLFIYLFFIGAGVTGDSNPNTCLLYTSDAADE